MYLFPKGDNLKELLAEVEKLIKTSTHSLMTKMLTKKADILRKRIKAYSYYIKDEEMSLSTREFDLLWLLASQSGRVLTRDSLLEGLDLDLDTSGRAIDMMMSRLRQRLADDPANPSWIRTVRGVGYLFQVGV